MNTERTTYFLMANLGSELIRFFALRKRGEEQNALASATRARKIIQDMSAREDIGNGKQELVILEKIMCGLGENTDMELLVFWNHIWIIKLRKKRSGYFCRS